MSNDGPEFHFRAGLDATCDGGGATHDTISTLMSMASLAAAPRFILAAGFCRADHGCSIQPGLIDIKDENTVLIERGSVTRSATATPTERVTRQDYQELTSPLQPLT
jgi:hypothetical protein